MSFSSKQAIAINKNLIVHITHQYVLTYPCHILGMLKLSLSAYVCDLYTL